MNTFTIVISETQVKLLREAVQLAMTNPACGHADLGDLFDGFGDPITTHEQALEEVRALNGMLGDLEPTGVNDFTA